MANDGRGHIVCPHCKHETTAFNEEVHGRNMFYKCVKCGTTFQIQFFGWCNHCEQVVGFQDKDDNEAAFWGNFAKSTIKLVSDPTNYVSFLAKGITGTVRESDGNAHCPKCGHRHIRCSSCGYVFLIGNNSDLLKEHDCPSCGQKLLASGAKPELTTTYFIKGLDDYVDCSMSSDEYSDYEEVKPKKPKKKRVNYKSIYEKHINNYIQNSENVTSSMENIQSFVQSTLELASADSNATRQQGYYCALADACIDYVLSTEDEQEAKECAAYVESALGDLMEHVGMDNVCDQIFAYYCIFCILNQNTSEKDCLEQIKSIDELFPLEPLSPISDLPFQVNDALIGIYTVLKEDALFALAHAMYENKQYIACQDGVNELEKLQTDGAIIWTNVFRSNFYYFGHGVPQDYQKAYEYSKKAAEYYDLNSDIDSSNRAHLGWVTALNALGYCYATGQGTSIDYDLAYKYIKRSADAGNTDALSSLGEMYLKGLAVPQDTTQARSYFRQALDGGDDSAQEFMDYLNGRTDKMPGLMKCEIAATASKAIPERIKTQSPISSSSESEYLAEYKEMLEDYGEIGSRERKQLEKLRVRLGLSESDVQRLETSFSSSSLTAEEQEYIEEYKEMLEDYGEITPRERKRLEKLQERLGLSPMRCVELEKL